MDGQLFAPTLEGLLGRAPIVVVPPNDELDHPSEHLTSDHRRRSAASALQDWINANEKALWGICCNGDRLRLVRDNASLTRPSYIEADLRHIFDNEAFADFTTLWLLVHSSRFGVPGAVSSDSYLEHWREAGQREGVTARDRLRDGVEAALLALGTGFLAHEKNGALRERLRTGTMPLPDFFGQLLRLVYRLIFLLTAEDRELLHMPGASVQARKLYADGYSLGLLRDRAVLRAAWDRHHDRWEGLLITFSALARGEPRLGLPALDGLFATGSISDLEAAHLSNRALMEGVYRLAWLRENSGLFQVNWRDMETEELGSVYESLLELTPRLTDDGHAFGFAEGSETKGHARKTTGSYYTPDSLVQALLDTALDPLLDKVQAVADDPAQALLDITVLDPACGSGHFLLAAARRIATRLARARAGGVASAADFRRALRDVTRSCIHGVDRNPMAVELTKVALWIETVDPGKPLGFLDANIRCGDSIFGIYDIEAIRKGIPDAAYRPLTGDDKDTAKFFEQQNKAEREGQGSLDFATGGGKLPPIAPLASEARTIRTLPEDNPQEICAKRIRFQAIHSSPQLSALLVASDLYVAAFVTPKIGSVEQHRNTVTIPTTAHVWAAAVGQIPSDHLLGKARETARTARAFHWPLEFPDVMASGGFDAVIGNPPWDVLQFNEEEYFASILPEVAELKGAKRKKAIAALQHDNVTAWEAFRRVAHSVNAASVFVRNSGRYPLTAFGKLNLYALFAEFSIRAKKASGRAALIVPADILSGDSTKIFFQYLIHEGILKSSIAFENEEFLFPGIANVNRFALVTFGERDSEADEFTFAFFLRNQRQLSDKQRYFKLSGSDFLTINPNTQTCPVFRTGYDADLTRRISHRVPVFVNDAAGRDGNPWGVRFLSLFNMTTDSETFYTAEDFAKNKTVRNGDRWTGPEATTYVPLYEGKFIWHYDCRFSSYHNLGRAKGRGGRGLPPVTLEEYSNPEFCIEPQYWVSKDAVEDRLSSLHWEHQWMLGWRDVANAKVERTMVPAIIPRYGAGHTLSLLFPSLSPARMCCLLANLSSIPLDYFARQKTAGTHLTQANLKQFPVLPPSTYDDLNLDFLVTRVIQLTYASRSMEPFARDLGYDGPPIIWDPERRAVQRAELDAYFARLYGLSRDELRYILDPTDIYGPDFPSETFRVLKEREIKEFGEYRTARLVLDAWDRMERGEIRDASLPAAIAQPAKPFAPMDLSTLPDAVWANPNPGAYATLAQVAALIKALPGPTPSSQVRLAALFVLEPRYLSYRLTQQDKTIWSRLVGTAANPTSGAKVVPFAPKIEAGWRDAVTQLLGMGAIIEDRGAQTWAAGPALDQFGVDEAAWPYGRATFVLQMLQKITIDDAVADLPPDDRAWVRSNAA